MSTYAYPNPQAIFYQQYNMARRDEVVGILLALFLGDFGVHHFYLRRTGLGILYLCFFWTGIPAILGFIECFFMPGRVREFNAIQAAAIAASLGIAVPGWGQPPVNVTINVPGNMPPAGASTVPVAGEATYTPPPMPLAVATYPPPMPVAVAQVATCASCQRSNPLGARFCSGCGQALA
jgi:TM2 domain-containing membrane protein YozV